MGETEPGTVFLAVRKNSVITTLRALIHLALQSTVLLFPRQTGNRVIMKKNYISLNLIMQVHFVALFNEEQSGCQTWAKPTILTNFHRKTKKKRISQVENRGPFYPPPPRPPLSYNFYAWRWIANSYGFVRIRTRESIVRTRIHILGRLEIYIYIYMVCLCKNCIYIKRLVFFSYMFIEKSSERVIFRGKIGRIRV